MVDAEDAPDRRRTDNSDQFRYKFGPIEISTTLPLESMNCIPKAETRCWEIQFCAASDRAPCLRGEHDETEVFWRDQNDVLSICQNSRGLFLSFDHLAHFHIDTSQKTIFISPLNKTSLDTVEHLLLDQVLPRVVSHFETMVMHAAGVKIDTHTVAFLGESGEGKSTLTSFCALQGDTLLSDDALAISIDEDQALAAGLYPSIRLWPKAFSKFFNACGTGAKMAEYSPKQRLNLSENISTSSTKETLSALFVLHRTKDDQSPKITKLGQQDACIALIKNSFQLIPGDLKSSRNTFEQAAQLSQKLSVYTLVYPDGFEHLPAVRNTIREMLHNSDGAE